MSQAGQDLWVYGEVFDQKRNGYFVDIGAFDGVRFSNTFVLEKKYKWRGICVEADPDTFAVLQGQRSCRCVNVCVDGAEGVVKFVKRETLGGILADDTDNLNPDKGEVIELETATLNSLLRENNAPEIIDYLSIDIEGAEERAFQSFDFNAFTFRAITIERPTKSLRDLFQKHGYILIKEMPTLDSFYIHESFERDYIKNFVAYYRKPFVHIRLPWSVSNG